MEYITIIIGGLLVWGLWRSVARPTFVISIKRGAAIVASGTVTRAFVLRVDELIRDYGIGHGRVAGYANGKIMRLRFSRQIPSSCRQQLRNWWLVVG
ncbi:MAG: DUF3634 family protein [Aeoliella sp.]